MIQLATLGLTPIVVEEGLKKSIPEKLYVIHTKDEVNYNFEKEAKKLKKKIEDQYKVPTTLLKVDAFDMDKIIKAILNTIIKERKADPSLYIRHFQIKINQEVSILQDLGQSINYIIITI